ncbi:hypothetical protein ACB087_04095 [Vibrio sp. VNB-15]
MAKEVGVMHCTGCDSMATVWENGGQKSGTFYTKCNCGTIQGGGIERQERIKREMVETVEQYKQNRLDHGLNGSNTEDQINCNAVTVIPLGGAGLVAEETVIETVFEDDEKPLKTENKGFLAMCCGLATCAGLMIGYQLGVSRG